jgi:hypothetical protein
MNEGFGAVADALERVHRLLLHYGDESTTPRLPALAERLRRGDDAAIVSALSEATGGMGSLNDRYLCPENGDKIARHEVESANKRLTELVRDVEVEARAAAAERGIRLMR